MSRDPSAETPTRAEAAVEVRGLAKTYRLGRVEVPALRDVSFRIAPGAFAAVTGASGSGKSTLLNLVGGLDTASAGTIAVHGRDLAGLGRDGLARFRRRGVGVKDPAAAVGTTVEIATVSFDLGRLNPLDIGSLVSGGALPLSKDIYAFKITGVSESTGFGPGSVWNELMIPPGAAARVKTLPFRSVWDIFRLQAGRAGYAALNVRLSSPADAPAVKSRIREMGFTTFALADQFAQIRQGFLFLDMVLAAIGMIAIFVAALGIINTMIMSILERTREIGIMKAVGAGDGDVRAVFVVEASVIGFLGGLFGYGLGWAVSRLINRVVNYFLARQGVPAIDYFAFPWWLFLGALAFAVAVSLAAGLYPARRAARVDPVQALRHD
jgi:putative ABC transport system permease protein